MSAPFWDRREPMDRLERDAGVAGKVIVTGCRGIGKSALADQWASGRAAAGKGRLLPLPPLPPSASAETIDTHLAAALVRCGVPGERLASGWRECLRALLREGAIGGVIVDGLETFRHALGAARFDGFVADLEALPGVVVATGVPAAAVPLSPSVWREIRLSPLDDECVGEIIERLWRSRGALLGEESRDLLIHLVGGSPLALAGWVTAAGEAPSLESLDRSALLSLHAGLLDGGVIGRWWGRWWEALFPEADTRRIACAAATALLSGAEMGPVPANLAHALETAGILIPTPAGHAPVIDPQARRVLRLAAMRAGGGRDGEVPFLEEEIRGWDGAGGLAEPRRIAAAVGETMRRWSGATVPPNDLGAEGPIPPLPQILAITGETAPAPAGLPFLLLGAVAAAGPLGGRWRVAVATGAAPLAAGEVAALAEAVAFLRRQRGDEAGERLWIVSSAGFTGGARTEATRAGLWHSDIVGLNALRAACGLSPTPPLPGRAARLPRAPITGQTLELSLPPAADVELVAAAAADSLAGMAGFGKEDRDRVRMAVVEAAINALEHGGGRVHLRLQITPEGIAVTVRDFGTGGPLVPGGESAGQPGQPGQRRGWGTAVMRQLMDEVRVESVAEGAKIVLVKRFPAGKG